MNTFNRPKKRFSQNFLQNPHYQKQIVQVLDIQSNDIVIEIGPGHGALTEHIITAKPRKLIAIEIDRNLAEALHSRYTDNITVIQQDILQYDFNPIVAESNQRIKIIGNLPYHITSPILFKLIDSYQYFDCAVMMMQKEVAKRITAHHGNKEYGILSVISQTYSQAEYLFDVGRGNFYPVPNVDSAILKLTFNRSLEGIENESLFRKIVRETFNYRRKMLRNSLGRIFEKSIVYSLSSNYIDRRPEQLTVDEFKILSNSLNKALGRSHG